MRPIPIFLLFWLASIPALLPGKGAGETVAHWLTRHGIPLTHDGLIAALNNPDGDIRVNAAAQLCYNDDKDAIPSIRDAAARESKFVNHSNMAYYWARLGDPSGADFLKAACSNASAPDWERLHAANNMLTLHSDACFPDVLSILQSSTDLDDAVQALNFCSGAKHELEHDGSPGEKKRNQLVLELVAKRVTDPIGAVRFIAGDTLAHLGDSSDAQILQDAIAQETNDGIKADMQKDLEILLAKPPADQ